MGYMLPLNVTPIRNAWVCSSASHVALPFHGLSSSVLRLVRACLLLAPLVGPAKSLVCLNQVYIGFKESCTIVGCFSRAAYIIIICPGLCVAQHRS